MPLSPRGTFESRDLYLSPCASFGAPIEWPSAPYFRLLIVADQGQIDAAELKALAETAVAKGAHSTLAFGSAADDVETSFDQAIITGNYETAGRTYLTAVNRDDDVAEALWDAFYTMSGDEDIEHDVPPILILIRNGDLRLPRIEEVLADMDTEFTKLLDKEEKA